MLLSFIKSVPSCVQTLVSSGAPESRFKSVPSHNKRSSPKSTTGTSLKVTVTSSSMEQSSLADTTAVYTPEVVTVSLSVSSPIIRSPSLNHSVSKPLASASNSMDSPSHKVISPPNSRSGNSLNDTFI